MSISIIIVLWIIISIAQAVNDRKKNPQPPPVPPPNNSTDSNFEIPTLANDPNQNSEIEEIDNFDEFDDVEEKPAIEEIYQQRKMDIKNKSTTSETEAVKEKNIELDLTPAAVLNAIVLNDILDKPKALRRRNF